MVFLRIKIGIRIDVSMKNGTTITGLLSHEDLEKCVGDAIASFAKNIFQFYNNTNNSITENIKPGVYFPEEINCDIFRKNIISDASNGAIFYSCDWTEN